MIPSLHVHYLRKSPLSIPGSTRVSDELGGGVLRKHCVDYQAQSVTTCGLSVGGMYFSQLTIDASLVTCPFCLESPKYPLDILVRVL